MVITISTSWSTSYQAFFKGSISVSSARSRRHATGRNCRNWRRIAEIGGELPKLEAFRTLRKRKRPSNPNVKGSRLIEVYRQRRSELGSMPAHGDCAANLMWSCKGIEQYNNLVGQRAEAVNQARARSTAKTHS